MAGCTIAGHPRAQKSSGVTFGSNFPRVHPGGESVSHLVPELASEFGRQDPWVATTIGQRQLGMHGIERSKLAGKSFDALVHFPRTVGRVLRRPFVRLAFHKNGRPRGWLRRLRSKEQAPALFDSSYYMERYSDVAKAGVDPYWHFVHYGWRQGRNPNEFFDLSWYLERNPDVREAGIDPLKHYIERGWKEGRDPGPKFSVKNYLDRYRDVQDAGLEPLEHYIRYGKLEGRLIGDPHWQILRRLDRQIRHA